MSGGCFSPTSSSRSLMAPGVSASGWKRDAASGSEGSASRPRPWAGDGTETARAVSHLLLLLTRLSVALRVSY